jgi:anti-sigma B factor antagonist
MRKLMDVVEFKFDDKEAGNTPVDEEKTYKEVAVGIMAVEVEQVQDGIQLVRVDGRLDQQQNKTLEDQLTALLEAGHHQILVDLSQTEYINSGGLRCLVTAWRKARQQKGNLVLSGLNQRLQEIFSMVGFDHVFQIFATPVEAILAFSPEE